MQPCARGTYSPGGLGACAPCASGFYAEEESDSCRLCPAGYYCADAKAKPVPCPNGFFSTTGANEACSPCPAGVQCGAVQPGFAANALSTEHVCPVGTYMPPHTMWKPIKGLDDRRCQTATESKVANWREFELITQLFPTRDTSISRASCQKAAIALGAVMYSYSATESEKNCLLNVRPLKLADTTFSAGGPSSECTVKTQSGWKIYAADAAWRPELTQFADWAPIHSCASSTDEIQILTKGTCARLGLARVSSLKACDKVKDLVTRYKGYDDAIVSSIAPLTFAQGIKYPFGCHVDGNFLQYNPKYSEEWEPCKNEKVCESSENIAQICLQPCKRCAPCPVGHSCLARDAPAVPCPAGTYSIEGEANCHPCPAGKGCAPVPEPYSVKSDKVTRTAFKNGQPFSCDPGEYSPLGNSTCLPCPVGHMCPSKDFARPCSPGSHAARTGMTACDPCPAGFECPEFQTGNNYVPCDSGHYSLEGGRSCTECPAGFYCKDPTKLPIPCPGTSISRRGQTACAPCPSGYSCGPIEETPCPLGQISLKGASTCSLCPAGNYCPNSTTVVACRAGHFSHGGAHSACTPCPKGSSCPVTDGFSNMPCPPGTWSLEGQTSCTPCPPGTQCGVGGLSAPTDCARGSYAELPGSAHCVMCPPGFSCGVANKTRCPLGWYSAAGSASCSACPAGWACDRAGAGARCTAGQFSPEANSVCTECRKGKYSEVPGKGTCSDCAAGTYAPTAGATVCLDCSAGFACDGPSQPVQCPAGKYSKQKAAACTPCDDGFACQPQSDNSRPLYSKCPIGYFCNTNFNNLEIAVRGVSMTPCPAGKYGTKLGAVSEADGCASCPAGFFCKSGSLLRDKVLCPSGFYCEEGTAEPVACVKGEYNYLSPGAMGYANASDCTGRSAKCPRGSYCKVGRSPRSCPPGAFCPEAFEGPVQCPAGKFITRGLGNEKDCHNCTLGSYCVKGAEWPVPCPAGKYGEGINLESPSQCRECEAGWACPYPGTILGTRERCQPGHYCPPGSDSARMNKCAAGTFSDAFGNKDASACDDSSCHEFQYCDAGTGNAQKRPFECEEGHYCPGRTSVTNHGSQKCRQGTFSNNTHIASIKECTKCPSGFSCNAAGLTKPSGRCAKGHYCPEGTVSPSDNPCAKGTWSPRTNLTSEFECELCPTGYECRDTGIGDIANYKCKKGFYMNVTGAKKCLPCQAGYYCPKSGTVAPVPCGIGSYSAEGSAKCSKCSTIRKDGSKRPFAYFCDSNTTSEKQMLSQICPLGTFCPIGTRVKPSKREKPCQPGHYCINGTFAADQHPCPPGFYNPHSGGESFHDACLQCPAGSYCEAAATEITGPCAAGYYCPPQSQHARVKPCPKGKFRDEVGARKEADCGVCPAGFYCPEDATVHPLQCLYGHFCGDDPNKESAPPQPRPCPAGTYGPQRRLRERGQCLDCPAGLFCSGGKRKPDGPCAAGYFCTSGAKAAKPVTEKWFGICPTGHYCGIGSRVPHACPPGKFNGQVGQQDIGACEVCEKGQYCEDWGNSAPDGACAAGYVCANYSFAEHKVKKITPAGTYAPKGSSKSTACLAGRYAPIAGLAKCLQCPAGYVCDPYVNETTTTTTTTTTKVDSLSFIFVESGRCTHDRGMAEVYNYEMCAGEKGSKWENHGVPAWFNIIHVSKEEGRESVKDFHNQKENADKYYKTFPPGCYFDTRGKGFQLTLRDGTKITGHLGYDNSVRNRANCSREIPCLCKKIPPVIPRVYEIGAILPKPCPAGYFCPPGSHLNVVEDCPAGTYGGEGLTHIRDCIPCEAGHYCPNATSVRAMTEQKCKGGYYCRPGSTMETGQQEYCETPVNKKLQCPTGHYCPPSTAVPIPCPRGKYSSDQGRNLKSSCKWCPKGQYCGEKGLAKSQGVCDSGFYCLKGADNRRPTSGISADEGDHVGGDLCPRGFYCPSDKDYPVPCPEGTYSNTTGAKVGRYTTCVS